MTTEAVFETPAAFQPIPATLNPFLALDINYVETLIRARGLCPNKKDPFDGHTATE